MQIGGDLFVSKVSSGAGGSGSHPETLFYFLFTGHRKTSMQISGVSDSASPRESHRCDKQITMRGTDR